jgi:2-polyprenyl-3-methyl-5-hydroxy-6-metoxy-1,4-benzoquinol methylase
MLNSILWEAIKDMRISDVITSLELKKNYYYAYKKSNAPGKVYWISPERIILSTNFQNETRLSPSYKKNAQKKTNDDNWDKVSVNFTDFEIYQNIKQTIEHDEKLRNADFFRTILTKAKSPNFWDATNSSNIQKLFEYLHSLKVIPRHWIENHRHYHHFRKSYANTIDVNIGRNGDYFFQNNVYLLSIAKVLRVELVPVRVFVRHQEWQKLKVFVINYLQNRDDKGLSYQPIVHPDFVTIPSQPNNLCNETMEGIKPLLTRRNGVMLDIGANTGFFCHKFEDLGYKCYAVENNPNTFRILEKIRDAEKKKFIAINKSVFEIDFLKSMQFDVVLALNILHHFLKTKTLFYKLKELLKNIETDMMFFSTAQCGDEQMRNAYQNYSERKFVKFVLDQTSLKKSEIIFAGARNRRIYRLTR